MDSSINLHQVLSLAFLQASTRDQCIFKPTPTSASTSIVTEYHAHTSLRVEKLLNVYYAFLFIARGSGCYITIICIIAMFLVTT